MQAIRTLIRKFSFFLLNKVIRFKLFFRIFNYFYENSSRKNVVILTRHIVIPEFNFNWKIRLFNNQTLYSPIIPSNKLSKEMAISYRYHHWGFNCFEAIATSISNENDVWIDCGSNLGLRSLTAMSKNLNVFLIEPNLEVNELCRKRCELNNFSKFKILPVGVSNIDTIKEFYIDPSSYASSLNKESISEKNILKSTKIKVNRLDTIFIDDLSMITTLDKAENIIIKIDVENHENEVLEGAKNLIEKYNPTFIIELNIKGENFKNIYNFFKSKEYQIFQLIDVTSHKNSKFLNRIDLNSKLLSDDFIMIKNEKMLNAMQYSIKE